MNATEAKLKTLNKLTTTVTACENWEELRAAMQNGYCPTLRNRKLRKNASKESRRYENATRKLRAMIRAEGFKVFDGLKVR